MKSLDKKLWLKQRKNESSHVASKAGSPCGNNSPRGKSLLLGNYIQQDQHTTGDN